MTNITGIHRNTPRTAMRLREDMPNGIEEERIVEVSTLSAGSSASREEEINYRKVHISRLMFSERDVEEDSIKRCTRILTSKLSALLYPTTGSYESLIHSYKIDRLARQMFYDAAQKSGAEKLYLSTTLDHGYQVDGNFAITIEQETGRFFLDTPFGRRKIKKPKRKTKVLQTFGKSKGETINGVAVVLQKRLSTITQNIFRRRRVPKTDSFIRFEEYIKKKWYKVNMEFQDENLAIHYCRSKDKPEYKLDTGMFNSHQINKIAERLRSKTKF